MSAIVLVAVPRSHSLVKSGRQEPLYCLMQHSPNDIKEKLLRALDKDNNVVDMAKVIEVIDILEKIPITKDELERTRLGKHINELRKKTANEMLAKRAKDLVRRWRKLIIPQENNSNASSGLNGERVLHSMMMMGSSSPCSITMTSHLPGPGPGLGLLIGGKPASPALANHLRAVKAISGLAQSSPGNSQCSSASTSPSVPTGISRLGSNRPTTPRSSGNALHLDGCSGGRFQTTSNFQEFKQVSPASNAIAGRTGTPSTSSPYGTRPVGNSLSHVDGGAGGRVHTNFQEFKPVSPAYTTAAVSRLATPGSSSARHSTRSIASSPGTFRHSPPNAGDKRRIASDAKRPRTDDDESCDSQGPALRFSASCVVKNSSSPLPPEALINGVDACDSMDSIRSYGDRSEEFKDSVVLETNLAKSKRKKRVRPERGDSLKDKLASHLRTPKVKTTAEIIKELNARNTTGSGGVQISPTLSEERVRVHPLKEDASLVRTRKAVYSSLLGTDEDVTRNKNELMEKFLKDSVGSEVSLNLEGSQSRGLGGTFRESPNLSGQSSLQYCSKDGIDPVDAILATLPPINAADIRWDEEDEVEEDGDAVSPKPHLVTDEMVQRLEQDEWESVNGNSDYQKNFKRWNEMSIQKSHSGDLLHILPYVDID